MQEVELKLTVDEVNAVLTILADRPFKDVAGLIVKIRDSANVSMQRQQAEVAASAAPPVANE